MDELLDRLPGGFLSFQDDGAILASNRTLREMLGTQGEDLKGVAIASLLTLPSRIFYQTHLFPLLKLQDRVDEVYLTLRTKTGEGVPVLLNARTVDVDGKKVHECLLIPMQARDKYEAELLRAKEIAEDALKERDHINQSLQFAHEALSLQQCELELRHQQLEILSASLEDRVHERTAELEQLVRELNGLTYSIAHNLRAPMRAILSISGMLHTDYPDTLSEDQVGLLDRQRANVQTLSSLIDDVLQLSRLGTRTPVKEQLDLSWYMKEAAIRAIAGKESAFELRICQGVVVWADRAMIATICACLMENAVKYSPGGGVIAFCGETEGEELPCFVEDQGIGMDPKYIHHIFDPFERLHREEFPGNGIGLAMVDRAIRHHRGRLWVESELGKGSKFFFSLPVGPKEEVLEEHP